MMMQAVPGAGSGGTVGLLMGIAPWLLIFVIFYFLMIRPQQQRVKEHQAEIAAVKKGDDVITGGGIRGRVTKVSDDEAEVEIAQGVKVRVVKSTLTAGPDAERQAGERLMLDFPRWKVWLISARHRDRRPAVDPEPDCRHPAAGRWPSWLPQYKINLGLDLAGGSHLLLEADASGRAKQRLQAMEDEVATELRRDPRIDIGDISTAGGRLSFMVRDPTQVDAAVERLRNADPAGRADRQPRLGCAGRRFDADRPDSDAERHGPGAEGCDDRRSRRRPPPHRSRRDQGNHRRHRGRQPDPRRGSGRRGSRALKKLIGQTARLEFKLVDLSANPQDVQQGHAPPGSQVLPIADGTGFIAVKRRVMVSGDQLTDAKQSFDQDGRPDIDITFNTAGARRFGRVTQENVGKPFAIILDDKVLSAPNINEPILGGRAQISGNFTVQSAHDLAVSLASGKLPVKLNVIEERTRRPRPRQGFDPQGRRSPASCRYVAVIVFMLVTYGRFGVYATSRWS